MSSATVFLRHSHSSSACCTKLFPVWLSASVPIVTVSKLSTAHSEGKNIMMTWKDERQHLQFAMKESGWPLSSAMSWTDIRTWKEASHLSKWNVTHTYTCVPTKKETDDPRRSIPFPAFQIDGKGRFKLNIKRYEIPKAILGLNILFRNCSWMLLAPVLLSL